MLSVLFVWLAALSSGQPGFDDQVIHDHFDRVTVHHFYDENAVHKFSQLIWWDWSKREKAWRVEAWKLIPEATCMVKDDVKHKERWVASLPKTKRFHLALNSWIKRYPGKYVGGPYHPVKNYRTGKWSVRFHDEQQLRIITSDQMQEFASQRDPEYDNREHYAEFDRRGFSPR